MFFEKCHFNNVTDLLISTVASSLYAPVQVNAVDKWLKEPATPRKQQKHNLLIIIYKSEQK